MAKTRKVNQSVQVGDEQIIGTFSVSAGAAVALEETVAINANQVAVAFPLNIANCNLLFIHCDQNVLIEVNSSSVPEAQLNLAANVPFLWSKPVGTNYAPLIFTTLVLTEVLTNDTITTIYVTNQDELAACTLRIEALVDPTP